MYPHTASIHHTGLQEEVLVGITEDRLGILMEEGELEAEALITTPVPSRKASPDI
jgi:hypothetical protein